jgi:hypothetical protein
LKRRALFVLALSVSFVTGLLVGNSAHKPKLAGSNPAQEVDAAFRDGVFQAKLDVQDGRKPHLSISRWNTEAARALFVAGYQKGYREFSEIGSPGVMGPSVAELAATGYRDGMLDGARHRVASQPYQPEQTTNYRDAGLAYLETNGDAEQYKQFYRQGYSNGYQQAYYSQPR